MICFHLALLYLSIASGKRNPTYIFFTIPALQFYLLFPAVFKQRPSPKNPNLFREQVKKAQSGDVSLHCRHGVSLMSKNEHAALDPILVADLERD